MAAAIQIDAEGLPTPLQLQVLQGQLEDLAARLAALVDSKRMYGGHMGEAMLAGQEAQELLEQAHNTSDSALALAARNPFLQQGRATSPRGPALLCRSLVGYLRSGPQPDVVAALQATVKLLPRSAHAWNCLAHCYWEAGDMFMARCCLTSGLRYCPSAAGHQMMSLLVRQQQQQQHGASSAAAVPAAASAGSSSAGIAAAGPSGTQGPDPVPAPSESAVAAAALASSLAHARSALELDLNNGYSWYVLAMAQMSAYFRGELAPRGAADRAKELAHVLAAFTQAERCGCGDLSDLYYNRAALHTFCQVFGPALQDYDRAAALDPSLPAAAQAESLTFLLHQLTALVAGRGGVQGPQWSAVSTLLAHDAAQGAEALPLLHHQRLQLMGVQALQPGANRGAVVLCRPLVFMTPPLNASGTLYVVCVDTEGCCFVLALMRIAHDAFNMMQLLAVAHPELLRVDVTRKGKLYHFPLVKVDSLSTVLVDGTPLQQLQEEPIIRNELRAA